jgi:hypothetical protein
LRISKKFRELVKGIDYDVNSEEFSYVYSKRNLASTRNILEFNKPNTMVDLCKMVRRCYEIGSTFSLEKHQIMYGDHEGERRYTASKSKGALTLENMGFI